MTDRQITHAPSFSAQPATELRRLHAESERNAAFCDECVHHRPTALTPAQACHLGHRPRFFIPYTMRDIMRQDYGWKRRCADFSPADQNPDVGNL